MNTTGKILVYGVLPLVLISGGIGVYIYLSRKQASKDAKIRGLATEQDFANLVKAAQQSTKQNKFKGLDSKSVNSMWNNLKHKMSAHQMASLAALYKLDYDNPYFDLNEFNKLNSML